MHQFLTTMTSTPHNYMIDQNCELLDKIFDKFFSSESDKYDSDAAKLWPRKSVSGVLNFSSVLFSVLLLVMGAPHQLQV